MSRAANFEAVCAAVAAMEVGAGPSRGVLAFGDPRLDGAFSAGGLPLGCWHEVAGEGLEMETAAAAGAFVATLARPLASRGAVVWAMRQGDLYAPGLASLGFPADGLIQVLARDEAQVLAAMEDALGAAGVAAVVGEAGAVNLTAGRRLQLACEKRGSTGFLIRRQPFGVPSRLARARSEAGSAAATRWTVASSPSAPPPDGLGRETPGLGLPRWRVELTRCRAGHAGSWILEKTDGPYPLRVVARLGDRQLEAPQPEGARGWRLVG